MSDRDIQAIYEYLSSIPHAEPATRTPSLPNSFTN
jgi:hypothetical protein